MAEGAGEGSPETGTGILAPSPYATVMHGAQVMETAPVEGTAHPIWAAHFLFEVHSTAPDVLVVIRDANPRGLLKAREEKEELKSVKRKWTAHAKREPKLTTDVILDTENYVFYIILTSPGMVRPVCSSTSRT